MIRELKNLATIIIKRFDLIPIEIEFKAVRRGRARCKTRKITIPMWVFRGVKEYQYYYIIHELVHFILDDKFYGLSGHSDGFRQLETQILENYNILPIYSKAYPKELRNLQGKKLCDKFGVV